LQESIKSNKKEYVAMIKKVISGQDQLNESIKSNNNEGTEIITEQDKLQESIKSNNEKYDKMIIEQERLKQNNFNIYKNSLIHFDPELQILNKSTNLTKVDQKNPYSIS